MPPQGPLQIRAPSETVGRQMNTNQEGGYPPGTTAESDSVEYDVRSVLSALALSWCGRDIFVARFREYYLLLQFVKSWYTQEGCMSDANLREKWEGHFGKILGLVLTIEGTIDKLATKHKAWFLHGKIERSIEWKKRDQGSDLVRSIQTSTEPEPIKDKVRYLNWEKCDMNTGEHEYQDLIDTMGLVDVLETQVEKIIGVPGMLRFTRPIGDSPDMVSWSLKKSTSTDRGSNECPADSDNEVEEARIEGSDATKVQQDQLKDSIYRGVIKLLVWFDLATDSRPHHGTGWLVNNWTVATAGHLVYKANRPAMKIDVIISNRFGSPHQVKQPGVHVMAHWGWIKSFEVKHDLAFVRLGRPFDESEPLPFKQNTLVKEENRKIWTLGYPANLDRGEAMYECKKTATWDLEKPLGVLEYDLSTAEGSPGSPVIDEKQRHVIGIHRGCGRKQGDDDPNAIVNQAVLFDQKANNVRESLRLWNFGSSVSNAKGISSYVLVQHVATVADDTKLTRITIFKH
ncbi:hypothetical protein NM208_g758 [Fusarium decemcellulare]|uniref:Uncharacterized protein n=1 Tax=Fusarium decemcellulare TaxID=57161 RepID=A0ACC1SYJ5_9HYPO|nr:hypothetical protein NM208_g758 [Fusarium decemcellulare]